MTPALNSNKIYIYDDRRFTATAGLLRTVHTISLHNHSIHFDILESSIDVCVCVWPEEGGYSGYQWALLDLNHLVPAGWRAAAAQDPPRAVCRAAGAEPRRASEKDAASAQKLGERQPFIAVFLQQYMGQLASFRAA